MTADAPKTEDTSKDAVFCVRIVRTANANNVIRCRIESDDDSNGSIVNYRAVAGGITELEALGHVQRASVGDMYVTRVTEHGVIRKFSPVTSTPPVPQTDSKPARTKCAFCNGPLHADQDAELKCMNATRFARRSNRRGQRQTSDD